MTINIFSKHICFGGTIYYTDRRFFMDAFNYFRQSVC